MRATMLPLSVRSILCAVDFSRHSAEALRYAAALGHANGASLGVGFAADPLLSAAAAAAYDTRGLTATAKRDLGRFVRATLGERAGDHVDLFVGVGKPAPTVLSIAERISADLVVVGTHGLSGLRKLFFGSTTEAILRQSTLPVLAVPRSDRRRATRRHAPVLVLTLPRSGRVGRWWQGSDAYRFARDAKCPVLVMRVGPGPDRAAAGATKRSARRRGARKAAGAAPARRLM